MLGKHHAGSVVAIAVIAAPLTFAVASCSNGGTGAASAIATSSAVDKAKDQVDVCVQKAGATALLTSSGRSDFVDCMKSLVSPAKQEQFKNCITSAATSDKLWTSEGRTKFTNESLPNCVNAAA
jgi:hypothetical protein